MLAHPPQATGYGGTVIEGKAVEDKIRRREENPDEEVERAAAAREVTVFFDCSVAGRWGQEEVERAAAAREVTLFCYSSVAGVCLLLESGAAWQVAVRPVAVAAEACKGELTAYAVHP